MTKRIIQIGVFLLSCVLSGTVMAHTYRFDNKSLHGDDWMDGLNWRNQSQGDAKGVLPGPNDTVRFNYAGAGGTLAADAGVIQRLQIGVDDFGGTLTLNPGAKLVVSENENYVGWNAKGDGGCLIVNDGSLIFNGWVSVANNGAGNLVINGGYVRVSNKFFHNLREGAGAAHSIINGGVLEVNSMALHSGVMDVAGGTVIIRGEDMTGQVARWAVDGRMMAYGGDGMLAFDYGVTHRNCTTIVAKTLPDTLGLIY